MTDEIEPDFWHIYNGPGQIGDIVGYRYLAMGSPFSDALYKRETLLELLDELEERINSLEITCLCDEDPEMEFNQEDLREAQKDVIRNIREEIAEKDGEQSE